MSYIPLTTTEEQQKATLKGLYLSFWDNTAFKKGWATPPFPLAEAEHLLDEAAELVVRIRSRIDAEQGPPQQSRVLDGSAQEYFWSVSTKPNNDAGKFVLDVVSATFQDANGFVEGLDQKKVLTMVTEFREMQSLELADVQLKESELQERIKVALGPINQMVERLSETPLATSTSESPIDRISLLKKHVKLLERIANNCERIRGNLEQLDTHYDMDISTSTDMNIDKSPEQETTEQAAVSEDTEQAAEAVSDDVSSKLLEIQRMAEDISHLDDGITELHQDLDSVATLNPSQAKEEAVGQLQKKCLGYANSLMKDLTNLDSITGGATRAERKQQVMRVQRLLDDVEELQIRLKDMHAQARKEVETLKQEESVDEKATDETPMEVVEEASSPKRAGDDQEQPESKKLKSDENAEEGTLQSIRWDRLKFYPRIDALNEEDKYKLIANVPGMKRENINIRISPDNSTLTIEGTRIPTAKELAVLKEQLQNGLAEHYEMDFDSLSDEQKEYSGSGRFGRFCERYRLPTLGVEPSELTARYEGGVLEVLLPKTPKAVQQEKRQKEKRCQMPSDPLLDLFGGNHSQFDNLFYQ